MRYDEDSFSFETSRDMVATCVSESDHVVILVIAGASSTVNCFMLSNFSVISPLEADVSRDILITHVLNKKTSLLNSQFPTLGKTSASLSCLSENLIFTDSIISSVCAVILTVSPINQTSGSTVTVTHSPEFFFVVKNILSEDHKGVIQSMSSTSILSECLDSLISFIT
jgi:hypothetical protein